MVISRRGFLRLLLASPIAATVDVEKLLWVPKPIITVPSLIRVDVFDRYEYTWKYVSVSTPYGPTHSWLKEHFMLNRDLFSDGAGLPFNADVQVERFDDDPDY